MKNSSVNCAWLHVVDGIRFQGVATMVDGGVVWRVINRSAGLLVPAAGDGWWSSRASRGELLFGLDGALAALGREEFARQAAGEGAGEPMVQRQISIRRVAEDGSSEVVGLVKALMGASESLEVAKQVAVWQLVAQEERRGAGTYEAEFVEGELEAA